MKTNMPARIAHLCTGLCAVAGIALTWAGIVDWTGASALVLVRQNVRVLSFFTILSNGMVAVWSLARAGKSAVPDRWPGLARFALLACISLVGLVYHFVLRELWKPTGLLLAGDILCHYVVPILFVAGWIVFDAKGLFRFSYLLKSVAVPLVYLVWVALLAPFVGVPYPFLDIGKLGLPAVGLWIFAIFAGFLALLGAFMFFDRLFAKVASRIGKEPRPATDSGAAE